MTRSGRMMLAALTLVASLALAFLLGKPTLLDDYGASSAVYDRHGELMRLSLAPDGQYRLPVTLEQVAPSLVEATLLYEDRWFYQHPGVNPWALVRAAVGTALGGPRRGASTLSMQVARLRFGIDSRSIPGKVVQIVRALQLELYYDKRELLGAYLTLAPYGGNIQGVQAAARIYFGKGAGQLSLAESLALAVMPQRPSARSPRLDGTEPDDMRAARTRLARSYLERHPETDAAETGIGSSLDLRRRDALPFAAPHLAMELATLAASPRVDSTIDLELQGLVERRVRDFVAQRGEHGIHNAAVLLVDHRTMEVLAAVGSADFDDADIQGQVDGTRARRSPGSTLKPFIYALALEHGLIHPRTLLKDAPTRFGAYNPENFDGEFEGPVSATDALVRSRNVPAVALETELRHLAARQAQGSSAEPKVGGLYDLLKDAGVAKLEPPDYYGLALVLGGLDVSLVELAELYAMLARGGSFAPLRYTLETPALQGRPLVSGPAAALTLEMLASDGQSLATTVRGSHAAWVRDELPVAWKTGTSQGYRDAWTLGVIGPLVLGVWVGNFDSRSNPAFVGRRAAAPLFFDVVAGLRPMLHNLGPGPQGRAGVAAPPTGSAPFGSPTPPSPSDVPGIADIEVCAVSGQIPTAACPRTVHTHFIPGVSPIGPCDIHRLVRVDAGGRRACPGESEGTNARVFELWPSDLARLFEQAGLPRVRPPPYAARCGLGEKAQAGRPPLITSPQPGIVYNIRAGALENDDIGDEGGARVPAARPDPVGAGGDTIPLSATADGDVERLHWFVDEQPVGESGRNQPLFWHARAGSFVVRVVDDSGRADAQSLTVAVVE